MLQFPGRHKIFTILWISLTMLSLVGCNHLFYYPTKNLFPQPKHQDFRSEEVTLKTPDGLKLTAWVFRPHGSLAGNILQFHGNAENISTHIYGLLWLVQYGFQVVTFDYRGYGSSQGEPSRAGLVTDGRTVLRWICQDKRFAGLDTVVVGQSLGGAVAVPSLALEKTPCAKLLVLDSTFASYRKVAQAKLSELWLTWPLQWPLSFLVSDEYSSRDYINQLKLPLLAIHATEDPVVPFSEGMRLYKSYSGKTTIWEVPGVSHTAALGQPQGPYQEKFSRFLCEHLDGGKNCREISE